MLVTVKTVKSSQVSLNSIQTNKNWSARKLQVVANLKPRKMMKKYVSQGMILSAEHDGKLTVLTVDPSVQMEVLLANSNSVL